MPDYKEKRRPGIVEIVDGGVRVLIDNATRPTVIEISSPEKGATHIMSPLFDSLARAFGEFVDFYRVNVESFPNMRKILSVKAYSQVICLCQKELLLIE